MQTKTLADIYDSTPVRVTRVDEGNVPAEQLAELGFLPGTTIIRVGQAPLGDPVVYSVRGARFALRRSDARQIAVESL